MIAQIIFEKNLKANQILFVVEQENRNQTVPLTIHQTINGHNPLNKLIFVGLYFCLFFQNIHFIGSFWFWQQNNLPLTFFAKPKTHLK